MSEQTETKTETKNPRLIVGRVVSDKMDKTITVLVERRERHPLYGKYVRRSTRIKAHDEGNECHEGDLVAVAECRPLSAHKHHRLVKVLERARGEPDLDEYPVDTRPGERPARDGRAGRSDMDVFGTAARGEEQAP